MALCSPRNGWHKYKNVSFHNWQGNSVVGCTAAKLYPIHPRLPYESPTGCLQEENTGNNKTQRYIYEYTSKKKIQIQGQINMIDTNVNTYTNTKANTNFHHDAFKKQYQKSFLRYK